MASTETAATAKEKYVDLFVQKGQANDDPNVFISINFVLPKGKTTKVPVYVKEEYERSLRAQEAFDETSAKLLEKATKPNNQ